MLICASFCNDSKIGFFLFLNWYCSFRIRRLGAQFLLKPEKTFLKALVVLVGLLIPINFWWCLPWFLKPEWIASLTFFIVCMYLMIPQVRLCDTCWPTSDQYCSWFLFPLNLLTGLGGEHWALNPSNLVLAFKRLHCEIGYFIWANFILHGNPLPQLLIWYCSVSVLEIEKYEMLLLSS